MSHVKGEQWAPVPGWRGYEASTRGRVRSVDRVLADGRAAAGGPLKAVRDKDGYRRVTLADGPRRQGFHVARLVLLAFAGAPSAPGLEALHGNGRRWDNRLANLRWGTRPENRADRERHRRDRATTRGEPVTKVTGENRGEAGETDEASPCPEKADSAAGGFRR